MLIEFHHERDSKNNHVFQVSPGQQVEFGSLYFKKGTKVPDKITVEVKEL